MSDVYSMNTEVSLTASFYDVNNALIDPTSVTLYLQMPDGTQTTSAVTKISTGVYNYMVVVAEPGTWYYKFQGTGTVVAGSSDHSLVVSPSQFTE